MAGPLNDLGLALESCFGPGEPARLFYAPGRVNVIGAHIDYSGGPVLTASIDLGVTVAARPSADHHWRLASMQAAERLDTPMETLPDRPPASWLAYPIGILAELRRQDRALCPLEAVVSGTVPIGAGLSSSAALLVAFAGAVAATSDLGLSRPELADRAYRAETGFVGVRVGRQDQMAAALGEPGTLLSIDFRTMRWEAIPVGGEPFTLLVFDSGQRRALTDGRFNERVDEAGRALAGLREAIPGLESLAMLSPEDLARLGTRLDPAAHRRARHVVSEVARVTACREAIRHGDLRTVGRQMALSHASSRLDYETSTLELDCLQSAAMSCPAVYGARLTGGGFGGCVLALCRAGEEAGVCDAVRASYRERLGLEARVHVLELGVGYHEVLS